MLYRQFYCWADTTTLLILYLTCIHPHLEYACTLWDPYTCKETHMIESVQKFACKVCLKCWDSDYDAMLHLLGITHLSTRQQYLKLTCLYKVLHGYSYFPLGVFVYNTFSHLRSSNYDVVRSFCRTNYLYHSFVPNVAHLWNSLPDPIKTSPSVSTFKRCLYHYLGSCTLYFTIIIIEKIKNKKKRSVWGVTTPI